MPATGLGTGNHWVVDVVGGWAVVLLGFMVVLLAHTPSRVTGLHTGGSDPLAWDARGLGG